MAYVQSCNVQYIKYAKGVQTAHVVLEYANRYKDDNDLKEYIQHDKTLIILDGGTSLDLKQLFDNLCENDIKFAHFIEPDLNDAISSICFWQMKEYGIEKLS